MNLTESLILLAASVVLLIFGRGRKGEGLSILRKLPWVAGQLFGIIFSLRASWASLQIYVG